MAKFYIERKFSAVFIECRQRGADNCAEMNLLVCDLDGTLTRTNAVDEECFVQAFADVFGIQDMNTTWSEYDHVTDLGVLHQVFQTTYSRPPQLHEVLRFGECFVGLLGDRHTADLDGFNPIPGAASLLLNLINHSGWRVAIATGSLEVSAKFKIRASLLPANDIPAAFAEDGPSREAIVRAAIERAKLQYHESQFERIVSIGDAVWDVRTARRLELPFVGVAAGHRAALLRNSGALCIIEDFLNHEHCMDCLESAEIPRPEDDKDRKSPEI